MRWRILGPVEAEGDSGPVAIERPQERGLLAYLLLNANRVVPTVRLIEAFWGDTPPTSARAQVQVCISHIRQALPTAEPCRLLTRAGGYRLDVADGEFDLAQFTAAVSRARSAAVADDLPRSADLLHTALAMWCGPAMAGATGAFVESAAAGLEERRVAAYEELAGIEAARGRQGELVAELSGLVETHPLRERLVGHLMMALAGSGQQARALDLYTTTRSRLSVALGVEPGPELAAAHLRVLRQELPYAGSEPVTRR